MIHLIVVEAVGIDARFEARTHIAVKLTSHTSQRRVLHNATIEKKLATCLNVRVVASKR